jgi:pyruvate,orthophosphate dikinase
VTGSSTLGSPEPRSTGAPDKFVFDFSEGGKDQKDLLGGKGANLAEMVRLGLPVPPGSPSPGRP